MNGQFAQENQTNTRSDNINYQIFVFPYVVHLQISSFDNNVYTNTEYRYIH